MVSADRGSLACRAGSIDRREMSGGARASARRHGGGAGGDPHHGRIVSECRPRRRRNDVVVETSRKASPKPQALAWLPATSNPYRCGDPQDRRDAQIGPAGSDRRGDSSPRDGVIRMERESSRNDRSKDSSWRSGPSCSSAGPPIPSSPGYGSCRGTVPPDLRRPPVRVARVERALAGRHGRARHLRWHGGATDDRRVTTRNQTSHAAASLETAAARSFQINEGVNT